MNVLSLFDGISCGRIALERVGIKVDKYYASEINETSIAISRKNYPDIIQIGDVREIDFTKFKDIDLLIGGSPCTNFSFSGKCNGATTKNGIKITTLQQYLDLKNQGMEFDGQSYLFWEYANVLKQIKPKYFLLENVKMKKEWQDIITQTLGVEPIEINSYLVSAQNRPRLYWTNIPNVKQPQNKGLYIKDVLDDTYTEKEVLSQKIQDRFVENENKNYAYGTTRPSFRKIGQRDWVFGDDNIMGCLTATDYKQPKQVFHNGVLRKISPIECERFQTLPDNYTQYGLFEWDGQRVEKTISHTKRFECIGNGWTVDVIAHILSNIPM